jgi:hypothetical protein
MPTSENDAKLDGALLADIGLPVVDPRGRDLGKRAKRGSGGRAVAALLD